jgi:hypothetical protein
MVRLLGTVTVYCGDWDDEGIKTVIGEIINLYTPAGTASLTGSSFVIGVGRTTIAPVGVGEK